MADLEDSVSVTVLRAEGDPPDVYHLEYSLPGVASLRRNRPVVRHKHTVTITLPAWYPRDQPVCAIHEPLFHPNVRYSDGLICIGDFWAASMRLLDVVQIVGEIIEYSKANPTSAWNGEAANWAIRNESDLPLASTQIIPPELQVSVESSGPQDDISIQLH